MIAGDEGKSMSIMEYISDEPRDARPFVDYLLKWQRGYREATWGSRSDDELVPVGCVTIQIDTFISCLESLAMKMDREASELQARIDYLEGTVIPHARKQEHANGFQAGWHSAIDRFCKGDTPDELRALVPDSRDVGSGTQPLSEASASPGRSESAKESLPFHPHRET